MKNRLTYIQRTLVRVRALKHPGQSPKVGLGAVIGAFAVGWGAHGLYVARGAEPDGSIAAWLLNAPVVVAETAFMWASHAMEAAVRAAGYVVAVIEIMQRIF